MIPFHPFADLFPLIEGQAFSELVDDVKANGLREPIIICEGQILDGRNRYRACIAAGLFHNDILPELRPSCFRHFRPALDGDPLALVLSRNLHRRHLSESQRAMVAAKLATMRRGARTDLASIDAKSVGLSDSQAAKALHVGEASVERAKVVHRQAVPELARAVEAGEVSVSAAADVAQLPKAQQADIVARGKAEILAAAKRFRAETQEQKKANRTAREAELGQRQSALPDKRYGVIYADPEWRFEPYSRESGMDRAADNHYPTSPLDEIKARPVASIAAADCVLFLWATAPMLPQALEVMAAWGFTYRSHAVWHKDRLGTGYWFRNMHELLLVGTRGRVPAPAMGSQWASVLSDPVGAHSAKPERFAQLIESYFPTLPKIELNARRARDGWDAWGFEAPAEAAE